MAGSMRHIILSSPAVMHIFPSTIKTTPRNIFFSSTFGTSARASLILIVIFSLYIVLFFLSAKLWHFRIVGQAEFVSEWIIEFNTKSGHDFKWLTQKLNAFMF